MTRMHSINPDTFNAPPQMLTADGPCSIPSSLVVLRRSTSSRFPTEADYLVCA